MPRKNILILILLVIVFHASCKKRVTNSGTSPRPGAEFDVSISLSRWPALNETTTLSCKVFLKDCDTILLFPHGVPTTIFLTFGDSIYSGLNSFPPPYNPGCFVLQGDSSWRDTLKIGDIATYTSVIKAIKVGKWTIFCFGGWRHYPYPDSAWNVGARFGDLGVLYPWVKEDSGTFWWQYQER